MINYLFTNPLLFLAYIGALVIAISVHEFSHAFVADQLGDPTPKLQGRLTLNPRSHMDLYGMIFLIFFGFGWGKPVIFDPYNLKKPQRDTAFISIAGPTSNIIVAIVLSIGLYLYSFFHLPFFSIIGSFVYLVIRLNIVLAIFNLIPIHPLDGFKIVGGILPKEKAHEWNQLERYGIVFLLMLIFPLGNGSMLDMVITPIISFIMNLLLPLSAFGGVV